MFNSTSDYEVAMREFLITIKREENIETILEKYGKRDGGDALAKCIDRKYTLGISYLTSAAGTNLFSSSGNIRLSFAGLEFLEKT